MKRVAIFGASEGGRKIKPILELAHEVVVFADNSSSRFNTIVDGIPVVPPEAIKEYNVEYIFIGSMYVEEIFRQLIQLGLADKLNYLEWFRSLDFSSITNDSFYYYLSLIRPITQNKAIHNELRKLLDYDSWLEAVDVESVTFEGLNMHLLLVADGESEGIVNQLSSLSMLSNDVLHLLRFFAERAEGMVLEIGPYIGGSTVAMADALKKQAKAALVSIEPGGKHDHPHIPSEDIFSDLKANLNRFSLSDQVILINGASWEESVLRRVKAMAADKQGIGMLFIDADGDVERDFNNLYDSLNDGCVLVFDDYSSSGAPEKEVRTKYWVDEQVKKGQFVEFGVFPWGTWFGRLNK